MRAKRPKWPKQVISAKCAYGVSEKMRLWVSQCADKSCAHIVYNIYFTLPLLIGLSLWWLAFCLWMLVVHQWLILKLVLMAVFRCDGWLDDALSSSCLSLLDLAISRIWIGLVHLCSAASRNACPVILYVVAGCCLLQLPVPCCYQFGLVFVVACVPSRVVVAGWILPVMLDV